MFDWPTKLFRELRASVPQGHTPACLAWVQNGDKPCKRQILDDEERVEDDVHHYLHFTSYKVLAISLRLDKTPLLSIHVAINATMIPSVGSFLHML